MNDFELKNENIFFFFNKIENVLEFFSQSKWHCRNQFNQILSIINSSPELNPEFQDCRTIAIKHNTTITIKHIQKIRKMTLLDIMICLHFHSSVSSELNGHAAWISFLISIFCCSKLFIMINHRWKIPLTLWSFHWEQSRMKRKYCVFFFRSENNERNAQFLRYKISSKYKKDKKRIFSFSIHQHDVTKWIELKIWINRP